MDTTLAEHKRALRRQMMAEREALTPQERQAANAALRTQLEALPVFRKARTLHGFLSLPGEVDTAPILAERARSGVAIVVPIQQPETGTLGWSLWTPQEPLAPGPFGVPEPPPGTRRTVALETVDLVLVPGVAFDRQGNRLGYGKGYYDGFLQVLTRARVEAGLAAPVRVALCFACQMVPQVPTGPRDQPVDWIITERETLSMGRVEGRVPKNAG